MSEPDTQAVEHKQTLFAQRRLTTTDTEHFITALGEEPQDYRHFLNTILFANSKHLVITLHCNTRQSVPDIPI